MNIFFIDTKAHLRKSFQIQKYLDKEFVYFVNNEEIKMILIKEKKRYKFFKSNWQLFNYLLFNKIRCNLLIAACVDSFFYQLILKFTNPFEINTFDEGVFTIQKSSIYNSQDSFQFTGQKRYLLLNFLFRFPLPTVATMNLSKQHFTWFPEKLFKNTSLKSANIIRLPQFQEEFASKIFIGQPWDLMGFDQNEKVLLREYINSESIGLYIKHPRETNHMLGLDQLDCIVMTSSSEIERVFSFMDALNKTLNIYSVASSSVINLPPNFILNIIKIHRNAGFVRSQNSLIEILEANNQDFNIIDITDHLN